MILAERLCLLVLDPERGRDRASTDTQRLHRAISGLVLVDLMLGGRIRIDATQVHAGDALPAAHPVLAEAAKLLATARPTLPLATASQLLQRHARSWQRRMLKSLAARDVLELHIPFPFLRQYRLRSRQAWNESLALLQSARTGAAADPAALALALATELSGVLADLMPTEASRPLLAALAGLGDTAAHSERHAALLQLLRGD